MIDLKNKACINNCLSCYLKDIDNEIKDKWLFDLSTEDGVLKYIKYSYYNKLSKPYQFDHYNTVEIIYIKYNGKYVLDTSILEFDDICNITDLMNKYNVIPSFCVATLFKYEKWIKAKEKYGNNIKINIAINSLKREEEVKNHKAEYLKEDYIKNTLSQIAVTFNYEVPVRMVILNNNWEELINDTCWLLENGFDIHWWEAKGSKYTSYNDEDIAHSKIERLNIEFALSSRYGKRFHPVPDIFSSGAAENIYNRIKNIKSNEILITSYRFEKVFGWMIKCKDIQIVENKTFGWSKENSTAGFIVLPDINIDMNEKYVLPIECSELGMGKTDMLGNKFPENIRFI